MSITLDSALGDYESSVHLGSGRREGLKANSHIKHRGNYPRSSDGKPELDANLCWYSQIVIVRGDWLVQNKPQIAREWLKKKSLGSLSKLAKKYLYWDYLISPRVARKIVYYALEKLVGNKELQGIDPDSRFYYRVLAEEKLLMGQNGQPGSSRNGQKRKIKRKKD